MKNGLILAGGAILAALLFFRKTAVATTAKLIFRGLSLKPTKRRIELNFAIQNPSNGSTTLKAITGEVFVNQSQVADFSFFGDQRIAARSESPLKINAQLSGGILSLLTQKGWLKKGITYTIKGNANFEGFTQPFTHTYKLK